MACYSMTTSVRTVPKNEDNICEILRRIEKIQNEAVAQSYHYQCDNCILPVMFNTKPIALWCNCCDRFTCVLETNTNKDVQARYFRVEEVRGNTVCLRLLDIDSQGCFICTDKTVILDCRCICAIQCFDPINCNICPGHPKV